jgi:hypothetical protein
VIACLRDAVVNNVVFSRPGILYGINGAGTRLVLNVGSRRQ